MTRIAISLQKKLEETVQNALKFADLSESEIETLTSALKSRYIDVAGMKILKQVTDRKGVLLVNTIAGAKLVFPTHRAAGDQQVEMSDTSQNQT